MNLLWDEHLQQHSNEPLELYQVQHSQGDATTWPAQGCTRSVLACTCPWSTCWESPTNTWKQIHNYTLKLIYAKLVLVKYLIFSLYVLQILTNSQFSLCISKTRLYPSLLYIQTL